MLRSEHESGQGGEAGRPPEPGEAFLALGSNLGDRRNALCQAVRALREHAGIRGVQPSPVYESQAHTRRPGEEHPPYLNAVVRLHAKLSPGALLQLAFRLEAKAGRDRTAEPRRWQPRPLDVDVLVAGRATRQTDRLRLPHPRLAERRFVLRPWADLAPNLRVPAPFEERVAALLARCPDHAALHRTAVVLR